MWAIGYFTWEDQPAGYWQSDTLEGNPIIVFDSKDQAAKFIEDNIDKMSATGLMSQPVQLTEKDLFK